MSSRGLFRDRELLLGVTGGIACYKTAALASQLVQESARISVVMTAAASRFIGAQTFAALTGRPVAHDLFASAHHPLGPHIELAERAELLCVAPATANFLGKAAQGLADDLLSTLYLCFSGPVLMAPAMNCRMWDQPAVQRNVAQLREDGVVMIGPGEGWLSCRRQGAGRMAEPDQIATAIQQVLSASPQPTWHDGQAREDAARRASE